MLAKRVLYYGKEDPLPEQIELRAGPLSLIYEEGDLRYIKLGEKEVIRRIYAATRDQNWGTLANVLSNVQMDIGEDSFNISYEVENIDPAQNIDFRWRGTITGDAQGRIVFTMEGEAQATFMRNRIGFCILHPAACADAPCVVEHIDGSSTEARLPVYIVPDQPVQPFAEMAALSHQVAPGVWVEVRFSGDIFEMEDQRNWTDASFKTFCTPLRLPFPVEVRKGTKIVQSVILTIADERPSSDQEAAGQTVSAPLSFSLDPTAAGAPLPQIGLGMASHGQPLSECELTRLKALNLHHLRVDLILGDPDYEAALRRATAEARALGLSLEVAVRVTVGEAEAELQQLKKVLDEIQPLVGTWLVYPVKESYLGGSGTQEVINVARQYLPVYAPAARFGSGTDTDFIFLGPNLPDLSTVDLLNFAIHPQAHAFDNASLVETLEAQAIALNSAHRLARQLPVSVSPTTLKMRYNPYATAEPPPVPPDQLPPQVDVRQMSLFGAAWTLGSIKYMAVGQAQSVTYYETTGWRGVMETEGGSLLPDKFCSLPGAVFPLYHVLADVGEFAGGEVIASQTSDHLKVDGLALRQDGRTRVLVANMSPMPQQVTVQGLGKQMRIKRLDETNAEQAMQSPEEFRARPGELQSTEAGRLQLNLLPYALVRLDGEE